MPAGGEMAGARFFMKIRFPKSSPSAPPAQIEEQFWTLKRNLTGSAGCPSIFYAANSACAGEVAAVYSCMSGVTTSDDYRPVAWMGRYPVDVTTILVIAHVAALIGGCLLLFLNASGFYAWLAFDSVAVLHNYAVHQLVTYAFVHAPSLILWLAIEMYMLFVFGREVERFLGRKAFIALYAVLLIGPSLLLTVWGLSQHTGLAGSSSLHLTVFVAFATIYPRVELMFRLLARSAALATVAALASQCLA